MIHDSAKWSTYILTKEKQKVQRLCGARGSGPALLAAVTTGAAREAEAAAAAGAAAAADAAAAAAATAIYLYIYLRVCINALYPYI